MPNRTPAPKTTTQKGLGHDHQIHRGRLMLRHIDGSPCWWCGRPMYRDPKRNWDRKSLNGDHSKSRARYGIGKTVADRLLHDTCNKQRGDGSRDDQRPALTGQRPEDLETTGLGLRVFDWP